MTAKYGNRNVSKMIGQIDTLRHSIRQEGTPAIQDAWDKVEEHIDFAYRADVDAAHRAGYDLAREDAADNGTYLVTYDVMMKGVK